MRNNKGMTLGGFILLIAAIAGIVYVANIFLTMRAFKELNSHRTSTVEESAKLVVSQFELAYNQAYLDCGGVNPSIEHILKFFEFDEVTKSNITTTKITDSFNTECAISSENNLIKVTCTNPNYSDLLVESAAQMNLGTCN